MKPTTEPGCCSSGRTCAPDLESAPIACTLDAADFASRSAVIRELARRWLRRVERTTNTLTLDYDPPAANAVRELVAQERRCCAFLNFEIVETSDATVLTIVSPADAADAAAAIFDEFVADRVRPDHVQS